MHKLNSSFSSGFAICLAAVLSGAFILGSAKSPIAGKTSRSAKLPTFCKDIAPIVFNKCASCHRPGQVAPFPLLSYEDVKKRGALIAQVVSTKAMPPFGVGACDFAIKDDERLSPEQIKLVEAWSETGMKKGSPADLPAAPKFASSWRLGTPDLVVKMSKPYSVPADGPDIYRNFVVPMHLDKDTYVSAVDFQPGTRSVVHHCLFYFDSTGTAQSHDGEDGKPGYDGAMGNTFGGKLKGGGSSMSLMSSGGKSAVGSLGGWAVGAQANLLPDTLAYSVPKGSDLILATHFHPTGKAETEQSTVGIYFAKKPPTEKFMAILMPPAFGFFSHINIPAGDPDYVLKDSFTLPVDCKAFMFTGHAHFLAKRMLLTATLPTGETKTLFDIPNWDFNWQTQYDYASLVPLPKGTKLNSTITYDNSSRNVSNPSNPPKKVQWGEQTVNEMGSLILSVIPANEEDYNTLRMGYRRHVMAMMVDNR